MNEEQNKKPALLLAGDKEVSVKYRVVTDSLEKAIDIKNTIVSNSIDIEKVDIDIEVVHSYY